MRRLMAVLIAAAALSGCRAPYMSDYANMLTRPDELPVPGIDETALAAWLAERGYVSGPPVLQSEAELRRRPNAPLVYAQPGDRDWWLTAHRTVQHACVTRHTIYYKLDPGGALAYAVRAYHNYC